MKKTVSIILLLVLMLGLVACGDSSTNSSYTDNGATTYDDGSFSFSTPSGGTSWSIASIPFEMDLDGKAVQIASMNFFELYADHGYTAYILVSLDRTNLSDDDIYWMTKSDKYTTSKELDMNVYATSEENEIDGKTLNSAGSAYDEQYLYFLFYSDLCRYSFMNSNFACQIIYTPTGITENDTIWFHYDEDITDSNYSDGVESLTDEELRAVNHLLQK